VGTTFSVIGPVAFASRSDAYVNPVDIAEVFAIRVEY
jgi:hypothetical protein